MDFTYRETIQFDDQRVTSRQKCRVETLQVEHASAGITTARVLDISRRGFRLLMPVSVPCGDEIVIHPPVGAPISSLRATVVRQSTRTYDEETWFDCGIKVAESADWRRHIWFLTLRAQGSGKTMAAPLPVIAKAA